MGIKNLINKLTQSQIWRSIFRHGWPNTDRSRLLTITSNVFLHLHPTKVKVHGLKFTHTFCLGGVSFLLFIILTITGVLLMFYYRPTIEYAYNDMKDLHFVVSYGMFLRNMHRWAAHGMVLTVILHMVRVFYTGAYKPPREFNWCVGVLLLALTLFLSFTGYLLPWDQLAYWAVTIGANMAKATPFIGADGPFSIINESGDVSFYLRGGTTIGSNTLLRFYVLHCILVPLFITILMAVHFWRVRKDGGIAKPL
ncbi:MAG: cytochrome b N-terminal domain-containing protein [Candidatus Brocadiales bacterium]